MPASQFDFSHAASASFHGADFRPERTSSTRASGERFVFLTTELSLRPGLIALHYFLRWKIEKAYDVYKSKLHQQKAWANGAIAVQTQAHLIALAHNLLTILLRTIESVGISEQKTAPCATKRIRQQAANQRVPAQEMARHATQLTCQFIRLDRHCLEHQTCWAAALPLFNAVWRRICDALTGHRWGGPRGQS